MGMEDGASCRSSSSTRRPCKACRRPSSILCRCAILHPHATAIGPLLSTMLYFKRFFPYFTFNVLTFNVLAGVIEEGNGVIFHYDAIGGHEIVPYTTCGSGSSLVLSVFDAQLTTLNQSVPTEAVSKQ